MPREKGCPGSLEKRQQCWCGAVAGSDKALWHRGLPQGAATAPQVAGDVSGTVPSHRALCRALLQHSPGSSCRLSAGTAFTPGKREGCVGAGKQSCLFPPTPQSTGQSYSHRLKEAPCLKHCLIIILALRLITHFLNPPSQHPLITSAAMRIQGVKITLGDLSVKNFKKSNSI